MLLIARALAACLDAQNDAAPDIKSPSSPTNEYLSYLKVRQLRVSAAVLRTIPSLASSRTFGGLLRRTFAGQLGSADGTGVMELQPGQNTVCVEAVLARQLDDLCLRLKLCVADCAGVAGFTGRAWCIHVVTLRLCVWRDFPARRRTSA